MWLREHRTSQSFVLAFLIGTLGLVQVACDTRESARAPAAERSPAPITQGAPPAPPSAAPGTQTAPAAPPSAAPVTQTAPADSDPGSADTAPAGDDAAYARDLERVCFAESRSGADAETGSARMFKVADWLGRNIESERGRAFLADFSRTPTWEKALFLEERARAVGITECPLVATWTDANTGS